MTDAQALELSQALASLADQIDNIVNNLALKLSDSQTDTLTQSGTQLTTISNALAEAGALAALAAAQSTFDTMTQATTAANAIVAQEKANAQKINALISVFGAAVTFGSSLIAGSLANVLKTAGALQTSAKAAGA